VLRAFNKDEPTRKRFVQEMISWSSKFGELERGDPELHHEAGKMYAEGIFPILNLVHPAPTKFPPEGEAYDAERHLLLGTPTSAPILAQLHYTWYKSSSPHLAALYASRSVLPYLVLGNLASATTALAQFTSQLTSQNPSLLTQSIDSSKSSARIFPSLPLLNFIALLLLACQKGDSGLFRQLAKHYASHLKEAETEELWNEALANIGEVWFGIRIPKQGSNPLFDMMSNMMFGGAQKQGGTPKPGAKAVGGKEEKKETAAPAAMDLD
jgi:golgi to ER traffic protein 4